jgi:hypothetical protein
VQLTSAHTGTVRRKFVRKVSWMLSEYNFPLPQANLRDSSSRSHLRFRNASANKHVIVKRRASCRVRSLSESRFPMLGCYPSSRLLEFIVVRDQGQLRRQHCRFDPFHETYHKNGAKIKSGTANAAAVRCLYRYSSVTRRQRVFCCTSKKNRTFGLD